MCELLKVADGVDGGRMKIVIPVEALSPDRSWSPLCSCFLRQGGKTEKRAARFRAPGSVELLLLPYDAYHTSRLAIFSLPGLLATLGAEAGNLALKVLATGGVYPGWSNPGSTGLCGQRAVCRSAVSTSRFMPPCPGWRWRVQFFTASITLGRLERQVSKLRKRSQRKSGG